MLTAQSVLILLLAAAFTVSPAAAWGMQGSSEPDTEEDRSQGWMYSDPDTDVAGQKLYFNAYVVQSLEVGGVNPNLLGVGGRFLPQGAMQSYAQLGVWKDCNEDGYIGAAQTALWEYRSELLSETDVCPAGSVYNKEGWVIEFIWVVPAGATSKPIRHLADPDVQVWADFGRPGVAGEVHYDCAQFPFPRGSFGSTGGLLRYFDCQIGYAVAKQVNAIDDDGSLGLRFDDPHHTEQDCSSLLNHEIPTYGDPWRCEDDSERGLLEEGTGDPTFTVWDCSRPRGGADVRDPVGDGSVTTTDPTGQAAPLNRTVRYAEADGTIATLPAPDPALHDPRGSLYDALNATEDGGVNGCRQEATWTEFAAWGDPATWVESDFSATDPSTGKRSVDFPMGYSATGSTARNPPAVPPQSPAQPDLSTLRSPSGFGVTAYSQANAGGYRSSIVYLPPTYTGGTLRYDLQPAGGIYFTAYAKLGDATLAQAARPTTQSAVYGAESCGGATSGILYDWDCDPAHWYNPALGGTADGSGRAPRPGGTVYHMRDTDCYDGALVAAVPVYASLAAISEDPPC